MAPSALGKRHRDSTISEMDGVVEHGDTSGFTDEELANQAIRHGKKRARLSPDDEPGGQSSVAADTTEDQSDVDAEMMALLNPSLVTKMPAFTVFTGPDETSFDGPPQQYLPHTYAPSPGGPSHTPMGNGNPMTATAFAVENQPPHFSFGYTSTPGPRMASGLQYIEEPQSPSPMPMPIPNAGMAPRGGGYGHVGGQHNLFNPYGMPPPRGTSAQSQPSGSGGINPALLLRPDLGTPKREAGPTSTEIGVGMGMAPSELATGTPAAMRKTMYGTEVDADTRFGDFGVEGVASGYWAGGRY